MSAQTTNTQFDFDGYSESDQAAVLDMAKQMGRLGETIKNRDIASARAIYNYFYLSGPEPKGITW